MLAHLFKNCLLYWYQYKSICYKYLDVCVPYTFLISFNSPLKLCKLFSAGREGILSVYCTSPQSYVITFLMGWINNFGDFYRILISRFIQLSVQTFQPLIVIYKRSNFVYHHWGCTPIYRPLSYPFRSLGQWAFHYILVPKVLI